MIGDPNWLYSTIAQSSAAIVAIVGGFITATVLMLMAEKRTMAHQQADKKTLLETLKTEEARLLDLRETMRAELWFREIRDVLVQEDELPSLEELMRNHPDCDIDYEILKREYSKTSKKRLEAREFIRCHWDKIDVIEALTFDKWVMTNKLDISSYDYDMLEDEYDRMCERTREALLQERKVSPALGWLPEVETTTSKLRGMSLWEQRELGSIGDRLANLRHEISLVESEVANLGDRLRTFSYPPNLGWGLVVLGYLAVFGIWLPVVIIWLEAYSYATKTLSMASFLFGIVGIFAYIVFQIRALRR